MAASFADVAIGVRVVVVMMGVRVCCGFAGDRRVGVAMAMVMRVGMIMMAVVA